MQLQKLYNAQAASQLQLTLGTGLQNHICDCRGEQKEDSTLLGEYAQTKLMNIMIAREMNNRLQGSGVDVLSCQPGISLQPQATSMVCCSWLPARLVSHATTYCNHLCCSGNMHVIYQCCISSLWLRYC